MEFLLLNQLSGDTWEVILRPGRKLRPGDRVSFAEELEAEILEKQEDGVTKVRFCFQGSFEALLDEYGNMPLPPYITKRLEDRERYKPSMPRSAALLLRLQLGCILRQS